MLRTGPGRPWTNCAPLALQKGPLQPTLTTAPPLQSKTIDLWTASALAELDPIGPDNYEAHGLIRVQVGTLRA